MPRKISFSPRISLGLLWALPLLDFFPTVHGLSQCRTAFFGLWPLKAWTTWFSLVLLLVPSPFVGAGFPVWRVIVRCCFCVATRSLGMMSLQPSTAFRCMLRNRASACVVRSCVWILFADFILLKNKLAKMISKAVLHHFSLFVICHGLLSHPIYACCLPSSMITFLLTTLTPLSWVDFSEEFLRFWWWGCIRTACWLLVYY